MNELEELLERMEQLLATVDELDESARETVLELLNGIDTLHRAAVGRLAETVDPATAERLAASDPAVAWLLDAYGVGADQRAAAESALDTVRPYIHSHGGRVDVLDASDGVVRLRMAGSCAGCSASTVTLNETIEQALRDKVPGFARTEVEEEPAHPHPPPGPVPVQIEMRRPE